MGDIAGSMIISIIIAGVGCLLILGLLFFLIKSAIQMGIRDAFREHNSGTDFEFKQTKLLAEIAKANGVSAEKIEEILKEKS